MAVGPVRGEAAVTPPRTAELLCSDTAQLTVRDGVEGVDGRAESVVAGGLYRGNKSCTFLCEDMLLLLVAVAVVEVMVVVVLELLLLKRAEPRITFPVPTPPRPPLESGPAGTGDTMTLRPPEIPLLEWCDKLAALEAAMEALAATPPSVLETPGGATVTAAVVNDDDSL